MNLHQPTNIYGFFAYAIIPENEDDSQPSTEEATITMIDGMWDHSWCSILQVRSREYRLANGWNEELY